MNELIEFQSYGQFKAAFDREARNQAENFVRMGYLLKVARDTTILYESGYKSITEFAQSEYGIPADAVSRMIAANDRYSENGYSQKLTDRYSGYGKSLLSEMLTLSDEVMTALPEGITRKQIRDIKAEIKEEQKITDLEVLLEEKEPMQQELESNLAKVLHQYYRENCREYPRLHEIIREGLTPKTAMELLAPSGIAVKMVRIPGTGKLMLSIKGPESPLELVNIRTNETEEYTWTQCLMALAGLCGGSDDYREDWMNCYGVEFPEIAPAQEPEKKEEKAAWQQELKPAQKKPEKERKKETEESPKTQSQTAFQEHLEEFIEIPKALYEKEERQWEAARNQAEKILEDLTRNSYSPDNRTLVLVKSLQDATKQLQDMLHALEMGDAWEKVS